MAHWIDEYPHELHANVLLLDNKIECWKVGDTKADEGYWPFKSRWKVDRMKTINMGSYDVMGLGDYKVETKTWTVNNRQEHNDVFTLHSKEWFKQWEHADDYKLGRAY
ncbi:hypothetical protein GCM10023310_69570 [Paenibacillus vulneris]|uniref:Uncharacterized protein n=1 Tax=Paenibacillus vulneris TaxID=1133364 RepID=A0ABW3UJA8_9BACL